MKNWMTIFAAGTLLAGCGDYTGGDQISTRQNESPEAPNFGSATDIQAEGEQGSNHLNAADVGIGGPVQRATGNYESQPVQGQASDRELAKKIKVALTTGSMGTTGVIAKDQLTAIDVSVENGVVTLRGPVSTPREKETVGEIVRGMKGVVSVRNELAVGESPTPLPDVDPLVPRSPGNE